MRETTTGKGTGTALDDGELKNFPRLQTGLAKALIARSRTIRALLLSSPAFRLLMFGSSISMLGTRISTVAFPMLVLHLNKTPFVTGLVAFAAIAPSMLVYIPAGVLVDRWNPRRVMLVSELSRGVAIASVVAALAIFRTHVSIWFLILAMLAEEILEIFSTLADRRYLNRVIKRDKIVSQQSSVEVRAHAAVLAGRPVGPFLFSIQPFLPFLADAVSFIASVASLLLLRKVDEPRVEVHRLAPRQMIGDIGQGFRWLTGNRRALVTIWLMAITSMVAQALILMFLVEAHSRQFSTLAIGIVLGASGAGGAAGSLCSRFVPDVARNSWLSIQMLAWSVALAFLALAGGQSVYLSAAAMFILGLTGAIGNVEFGAYLVRSVADDMVARVTGIGQMLAIGACALGPVLGGYAIQQLQVQGAILILLAIVLSLAFISLLLPEASNKLAGIIRGPGQFIRNGRHAFGINIKMLGAVPAHGSRAGSRQDQDGEQEAIMSDGRISLIKENGRLPSSIDAPALNCSDTSSPHPKRTLLLADSRSRPQIREGSGGSRKHWNLPTRQA